MGYHQTTRAVFLPQQKTPRGPPFLAALAHRVLRKVGLDRLLEYLVAAWKGHPTTRPYLPRDPATVPPYLYDFHCHTSVSDGLGTVEAVLDAIAAKEGTPAILDGLAFTDHPWSLDPATGKTRHPNEKVLEASFHAAELARQYMAKRRLPAHFTTFPGSVEFACKLSPRHPSWSVELVALGLPRTFLQDHGGLRRVRRWHALELVDEVHAAGGLVIAPHPFYFVATGTSQELLRAVDAVEMVNHTTGIWGDAALHPLFATTRFAPLLRRASVLMGYNNWRAIYLAQHAAETLAFVGSSDAHIPAHAGAAATGVSDPVTTIDDLRRVLQRRETTPLLNPRWDARASSEETFPQVLEKWGEEFFGVFEKLERDHPGILKVLGVITRPLDLIRRGRTGRSGSA